MLRLFILLILYSSHTIADTCDEWFRRSKIKADSKDCLMECGTLDVDMGTFECANQCVKLCKPKMPQNKSQMNSIVDVAGLTKEEIILVAKNPTQAKVVYEQKGIAEEMTKKRFDRDWFDDESDAYRHFVWTGLLIRALGKEWALKFLEAHESASPSDDASGNMDRKNNEVAIKYADRLQRAKKLDPENLDKAALNALKRKELKVIRPLGGPK